MKRFIKINIIILVIFCLSCNFIFIKTQATSEEPLGGEQQDENLEQNTPQEERRRKRKNFR